MVVPGGVGNKKTPVNQQRWIVPALVSVSLLTCTCMSSGRHAYMYMCILGRYAFVVVPGEVSNIKKYKSTNRDGWRLL